MNDELERLMREATQGELAATPCKCGHRACRTFQLNRGTFYQGSGFTLEDAALIVAAVNALPELLAKVKRLEEALAILDAAHEFEGEPDDKKLFVAMRVADLRRASAALNQEPTHE